MRGTYFVKHLKGTGKGNIEKLVESQATRTQVANAVACSKAVGEAMKLEDEDGKDHQLWEDAGESVLEHHEKDINEQI